MAFPVKSIFYTLIKLVQITCNLFALENAFQLNITILKTAYISIQKVMVIILTHVFKVYA